MGKKLWFLIPVMLLCLAGCESKEQKIIKLGDSDITAEQIKLYEQRYRSEVISDYQEENEAINKAFWQKKLDDGITVQEKLTEKAKESCFFDQMVRNVAKEKGIIDNADFLHLKEEMKEENKEREKAVSKGQVVYGNKSYNLDTYVSYSISNLKTKLIEEMADKELKFSDSQLRDYCKEMEIVDSDTMPAEDLRAQFGEPYKRYLFDQYIKTCIEKQLLTTTS